MRRLLAVIAITGCTTAPSPPPPAAAQPEAPYGFTVEEEARILQLEDRREYGPSIVERWVDYPNWRPRSRIALALGRIGPHTFIDSTAKRERDPTARQAGAEGRAGLAHDRE